MNRPLASLTLKFNGKPVAGSNCDIHVVLDAMLVAAAGKDVVGVERHVAPELPLHPDRASASCSRRSANFPGAEPAP